MLITLVLDTFTLEGNWAQREPAEDGITTFEIKTTANFQDVAYPKPGPNFHLEKKAYVEKYGPYSAKYFESIMKELLDNFVASKKLPHHRRNIQKVWVLKQLYELFDGSLGLLIVRKPYLLTISIAKALEVLRDPTIEMIMEDHTQLETTKSSVEKSLQIIQKIYTKIANIVTSDMNFLKLLPTTTLITLVEYASHKMVSKFRRLPWIDPVLVDRVTPKFNIYWRTFWQKFFVRNFKLDYYLCIAIAEFMPMKFKKEPFLDFFRRKYNTQTQEYVGKRIFDVEQTSNTVKIIIR